MPRRSTATEGDPYDALANALRAVVEDMADRIAASVVAAVKPMTEALGIEEAATRLGLRTSAVKRLIASGELPSILLDDDWRVIPVNALEALSDSTGD
jgi:ectoine hydroxylase-related dioxygenase (phytanoyl-CoA dioxygenase family)